ncbi:TraR/DksA C4-type zinc finger protein [bacterium]|nr:TraR/DksA C4-type zinc finger protein [bacterium]
MKKNEIEQIREKLMEERQRLVASAMGTLEDVRNVNMDDLNDEVDFATAEQNESLSLRLRDREAVLLAKIDETLDRIRNGDDDFGYCERCGNEIGIQRLLVRPVATLCIRCKEEQEKIEAGYAE